MLTPAQRERRDRKIVDFYTKGGLSTPQISARVGLSTGSVGDVLRAHGVRLKPNGSFAKPIAANQGRNDRIVRLYTKDRLSAKQISEQLGTLTADAILRILASRGVKRRKRGWHRPTPEYSLRLRRYAEKIAPIVGTRPGCSAAELARRAGYKPATLRIHLRALGVWMRSGMDSARLSVDDVSKIKRLLAGGKRTYAQIAEQFYIGNSTVWSIASGNSWGDVPWPDGSLRRRRRRPARSGARKKSTPKALRRRAGRSRR